MLIVKAITTLATAAIALSLAVSAKAAVFADFTPDTNKADFSWVRSTNNALGAFSTEGTLKSVNVATHFSFIDPSLAALAFLPATFNLTAAVTTPSPATFNVGTNTWTESNLHSTGAGFSFIYSGPTTVIAGHTLTHNVTNLLSGVFTGAYIQGFGSSGSTNLQSDGFASVTYFSDVIDFSSVVPGSTAFAFNLLSVNPHFGASAGHSLNSFAANGGGNFSADFHGIPEPATWAMMLVGFGGIGLMVRNRRRAAVAAA
jgi:hypothetical protein